ncbi:MAG: hypothetical protein Q4G40_08835, partial [Brachybacterium sp.]|nr:hypothetical protein [Brachybacterium sp.]
LDAPPPLVRAVHPDPNHPVTINDRRHPGDVGSPAERTADRASNRPAGLAGCTGMPPPWNLGLPWRARPTLTRLRLADHAAHIRRTAAWQPRLLPPTLEDLGIKRE